VGKCKYLGRKDGKGDVPIVGSGGEGLGLASDKMGLAVKGVQGQGGY